MCLLPAKSSTINHQSFQHFPTIFVFFWPLSGSLARFLGTQTKTPKKPPFPLGLQPWKINMQPTNHPFSKENDHFFFRLLLSLEDFIKNPKSVKQISFPLQNLKLQPAKEVDVFASWCGWAIHASYIFILHADPFFALKNLRVLLFSRNTGTINLHKNLFFAWT